MNEGIYCPFSRSSPCLSFLQPHEMHTPGPPVHHQLPESTQTYVHRAGDAPAIHKKTLKATPTWQTHACKTVQTVLKQKQLRQGAQDLVNVF